MNLFLIWRRKEHSLESIPGYEALGCGQSVFAILADEVTASEHLKVQQ
jgi:hypothetical protein